MTKIPILTIIIAISLITGAATAFPVVAESAAFDETPLPLTRHVVVADVHYTSRTIAVQQRIYYTNHTDATLDRLVLNVEPNRLYDVFTLSRLESGGQTLEYTLSGKRLEVTLMRALAPGQEVVLVLDYRLNVPMVGDRAPEAEGYFGYTHRQLNLGHWLATVAPFDEGDWVTHESSRIGEHNVLEMADWEVAISFIDPSPLLTIAAPGRVMTVNHATWMYILNAARDFTVSISDRFVVSQREARSGVTVELYTLDGSTPPAAVTHALDVAVRSLAMFDDLFGSYPHERMVVVQGDFPDGMEFSGLVFVGDRWFTTYTGNPASYLTLITAHEISHQWWYASVGNDSAIHPWLDEAFATYSEYIFIEEYYPESKRWWWRFRVEHYALSGYVDSTIYIFANRRDYINTVYLRGALLLRDLREDLGTEAFFQFLADYAEAGSGRIVTPDFFWSLLTPEQLEQTQATRERYLQWSDVKGDTP